MTTEDDAQLRRRLIENELKLRRLKRTQSERMKWKWLAWKWTAIGALSKPQTYVYASLLVVGAAAIGFTAYVANFELKKARQARWNEQAEQSREAQARWDYDHRQAKLAISTAVDVEGFGAQLCNATASVYGDDTGPNSLNRLSFSGCMAKASSYKYSPPSGLSAEREALEKAWGEEWGKPVP